MTPRAKLTAALAAGALAIPAALLYFHGPASALSGLSRSYYNAVYALTKCPAGTLAYEDGGTAFSYLDSKASPEMGYVAGPFDPEAADAVPEVFRSCVRQDSIIAGNAVIRRYKGCPAAAAGKGFEAMLPYLRKNFGAAENAALSEVPGKPGLYAAAARYRPLLFFRDSAGTVYWYPGPRPPMLAGSHGFFKELFYSAGLSGAFGPHYIGLARWFSQPAAEKRCLCNFDTIIRTLRIK